MPPTRKREGGEKKKNSVKRPYPRQRGRKKGDAGSRLPTYRKRSRIGKEYRLISKERKIKGKEVQPPSQIEGKVEEEKRD